jgi:phosphatidylglycerophosphate synthase
MQRASSPGIVRYVPNALTVLRLCALPVIVYLYSLDAPGASWTTAIVILIAALSDVADGYIARPYHVQSEFGLWVHPIVDRAFLFTIVAMRW